MEELNHEGAGFLKEEIRQLNAQIELLSKENFGLKKQVSEVSQISDKLSSQHEKNKSLIKSNHSLQLSVESSNQTVMACQKRVTDLEKQITDERSQYLSEIAKIEDKFKKEMDNYKKTHEEHQNYTNQINNDLISKNSSLETAYKTAISRFDTIIESASFFFGQKFDNDECLFQFLNSHSLAEKESTIPNSYTKDLPLEKKNKKYKSKLKQISIRCNELESEMGEMKNQYENSEKLYKNEIEGLKLKNRILLEEKENSEATLKSQLKSLEIKAEGLKTEIIRQKKSFETSFTESNLPLFSKTSISNDSLNGRNIKKESMISGTLNENKNNEQIIDLMTKRNTSLVEQLAKIEKKNEELINRVNLLGKENNGLNLMVNNLKTEIETCELLKKEALSDAETLRHVCNSRESSKNSDQLVNQERLSLKSHISQSNRTIELLKKQMNEANLEISKLNSVINELKEDIYSKQDIIEKKESDVQNLIKKNQELNSQIEANVPLKESDILPPNCWRFDDFGNQLSSKIEMIGNNDSLQPSSKIQTIFGIIRDYYINQINSIIETNNGEKEQIDHILYVFNQFLLDISIGISGQPLNIRDFAEECVRESLISLIISIKKNNDENRRKNDSLLETVKRIEEVTSYSKTQSISLPLYIQKLLNDLRSRIEKMKKNSIELKGSIGELLVKISVMEKDHVSSKNQMETQIFDNQNTIKKYEEEVSKLKKRISKLNGELKDIKMIHEENESRLLEENEQSTMNAKNEISAITTSYNEELSACLQVNEVSKQKINVLERELLEANNNYAISKEKNIALENENKQMKAEYESTIGFLNTKYSNEKEMLVKELEKLSETMKEKSSEYRVMISNSQNEINVLEKNIKDLKQQLSQLKNEKSQLEYRNNSTEEEYHREKAILETNHKADLIKAEEKKIDCINKERANFQQERSQVFAAFAKEFSEYVVNNTEASDRILKTAISKLGIEYKKLKSSDAAIRRMLKTAPSQTTEDSVAHLILS